MKSEQRRDETYAADASPGSGGPLWEVSVLELKRALAAEIETLEERTGSLENEKAGLPGAGVLPLRSAVSSRIRFLQRMAQVSALRRIGGERLSGAEAALTDARSELDEVAAGIDEHNATLQQQSAVTSVLRFVRNHREANRLAARRRAVLRAYRRAEKRLEAVFIWIRDEGYKEAGDEVGRQALQQSMALLYRYRGLEIEHSFLHDELSLRRELQAMLADVADDRRIFVRHRTLDKVIRDPLLKSRIATLIEEQQQRG